MPIQTLAQQFKESLERHEQDPGRSETPVSLYDKRRNFSYNAKYNRVPPNADGRKLYQEMQAKREKERGVKEQSIKEKFGISMNDVESTKKNDIWNKNYVQRRPTTLSSQATRQTPSWLKLAAEKSDVTGLMAAYARRREVELSKPQEDNYISEACRRGDSFHGLPPAPTPSPLPQQSPYRHYREHNIGYGASNQTRTDVHQGQPEVLLHPPQTYQQHHYPENQQLLHVHQPRAHPTPSQHDSDLNQQNSFSFPHQCPHYNNQLVLNDQRYYFDQNTARYSALPSTSYYPGTASNILAQSWQNGGDKTLHSTESISSFQPFDIYTSDATSTPQRDNRFLKAPHYPSSGSSHSQQPFYPEYGGSALDHRHGANYSIPDSLYKAQQYPTTSMNIPQYNPMSNQEQYSQKSSIQHSHDPQPDRTVLLNGNPYYQASLTSQILTPKNGDQRVHVRFRSTPEVFHLPPQPYANLSGNIQDGSGMTPIPSHQVRQTYQDIHSRHSVPLAHPQPSPGWIDNTSTNWYQPVSGPLPVHEQAANINSAPPAGLQEAHEEIVQLRKAKRQKKSSQSGKAQRLSEKVVNDLERIADGTVDELDLLRPEMLRLDDQPQGDSSMASDHTHLLSHPQNPREKYHHRSPHTHDDLRNQEVRHRSRSHHDDYYTDDTETNTDDDSYTSDNSLSSTEDDDAYIPSAHSHGSRGSSHSHRSISSSHSQRIKGSTKRRRTTSKTHRRKYGSQRRKRARYTHPSFIRYERLGDTTEDSSDTSDQTQERYDPDVDVDNDEDMEEDPLPPRQKVPRPVKPLSAIADTVRLPPTTKTSKPKSTTRGQANMMAQVRKARVPITDTGKRRKRNVRIPSPVQTVLGEDIEVFSDDEDEEQDDDEVMQDDIDEIQTNKVKARGRWLRDYEERDRLSTVEEENEEQEDKTEAHGGDTHREYDGVQVDERTEEDKFWGDGGDLGFKIWRDGY
ncbi:hypothetical protein I203_103133 [Kwoniella mangroviensis CBS 8507]|uniref:uncharacterized protein n=1 Tax=Kwoniella mangroviensis CBS 8507 TaxID=1296122 RepID=UPI00080D6230|nr:uncharacterized protein I203_07495 [Kwoniella mangroviensis CBS 8507]OCF63427.1 hypothetical protein I203_07495 [Kwoniella mangroviensis CBS 8507]